MSEKITLQSLSDAFAASNGLTKKLADNFLKQFFDVVQEGLQTDGMVKVKGLGTFKLVDVADRESVSVSTGERFVIPGYKKVSFVPDEEINTMLTEKIGVEDEEESADESADENEEEIMNEEETKGEVMQKEAIKEEEIEKPDNEFSAIDLLISTPESIEEARLNLQQAREAAASMQRTAEEALVAAREAHREVIRLEVLVQRLETNAVLEAKPEQNANDNQMQHEDVSLDGGDAVEQPVNAAEGAVCVEDRDGETETATLPVDGTDNEDGGKSRRSIWIVSVVLLFLLIIVGGGYWYYNAGGYDKNIVVADSVQNQVEPQVLPIDTSVVDTMAVDTLSKDSVTADSLDKDTVSVQTVEREDTVKPVKVEPKVTQKAEVITQPVQKKTSVNPAERPKTYKMKNGDTLMKIARRFYGDASYAVDIIKANNFSDPNNVHIGTEIILP